MIAQLGERQTEDLKVPGSIPGRGSVLFFILHTFLHPGSFVSNFSHISKCYSKSGFLSKDALKLAWMAQSCTNLMVYGN